MIELSIMIVNKMIEILCLIENRKKSNSLDIYVDDSPIVRNGHNRRVQSVEIIIDL